MFCLAGGMVLFSVVINSFVHVIMYSYYFAALFGPAVQRKLEGIKRNITLIQMVMIHRKPKVYMVNALITFLSLSDPIHYHSDTMCPVFGARLWCTKVVVRDLCAKCFAHLLNVLWFLQKGLQKENRFIEGKLSHRQVIPNAFWYRNNFMDWNFNINHSRYFSYRCIC